MINTRKTYLKVQVSGVLGSKCSPVLVDILLHVGIIWCEKPILTRSATVASCRSKYMLLQLSLLTNGELVNYSHLGIISETNVSYGARKWRYTYLCDNFLQVRQLEVPRVKMRMRTTHKRISPLKDCCMESQLRWSHTARPNGCFLVLAL